jgi:hypothetical protein
MNGIEAEAIDDGIKQSANKGGREDNCGEKFTGSSWLSLVQSDAGRGGKEMTEQILRASGSVSPNLSARWKAQQ